MNKLMLRNMQTIAARRFGMQTTLTAMASTQMRMFSLMGNSYNNKLMSQMRTANTIP